MTSTRAALGHISCFLLALLRLSPGAISVGLLILSIIGTFLYVLPPTERPQRSDVLLVLAPSRDRIPFAKQLMEEGYAHTLVVSAPVTETTARPEICGERHSYRIICFAPNPVTTQGEARALRTLADEYGWDSANVVTAQFHVTRARIILKRCYAGDVRMVAFTQPMPVPALPGLDDSWAYRIIYENAAFVKAALNPFC